MSLPRYFAPIRSLILPNSSRYSGSLTTPPCTQGVNWYVADKPIKLNIKRYLHLKYLSNVSNSHSSTPIESVLMICLSRPTTVILRILLARQTSWRPPFSCFAVDEVEWDVSRLAFFFLGQFSVFLLGSDCLQNPLRCCMPSRFTFTQECRRTHSHLRRPNLAKSSSI